MIPSRACCHEHGSRALGRSPGCLGDDSALFAPARLQHIPEIESCHSVAGEESYVLLVRVASARALEDLLQRIRTAADVRTRSTIILQTFYSGRDYIP